jgi:hypothetical protein
MAVRAEELYDYRTERQADFQKISGRFYQIPLKSTLADVSLETGDTLTDNASAEIVYANDEVARTDIKTRAGFKLVEVRAVEWLEYA